MMMKIEIKIEKSIMLMIITTTKFRFFRLLLIWNIFIIPILVLFLFCLVTFHFISFRFLQWKNRYFSVFIEVKMNFSIVQTQTNIRCLFVCFFCFVCANSVCKIGSNIPGYITLHFFPIIHSVSLHSVSDLNFFSKQN